MMGAPVVCYDNDSRCADWVRLFECHPRLLAPEHRDGIPDVDWSGSESVEHLLPVSLVRNILEM